MPNDWGVPPKNFGRFIPCRGGGTDTTYYTDQHDVDEDRRTICNHGGREGNSIMVGVMNRYLYNDPTTTANGVASRLIYLS